MSTICVTRLPPAAPSAGFNETAGLDPRRWRALPIIVIGSFLAFLDFFIVNIALPAMRADLGASPAQLQFIVAAYGIAFGVSLITGGRLGDIFGRKRVFLIGSITEEQYDDTFGRNVKGVLFTVQKALPLLVDGASVILTGSTASIVAMPAFSVYGASKAALRSFARHWTLDLKARRIRVNVLSPGPTKTPGLLGLAGDDRAAQQGMLDQMASELPLGRVADPDEIASAVLFLASDDSSFVTGAELFVDGGQAQV